MNIEGSLLIVGGGLSPNNSEVYERFIEMAGGRQKAVIGIIPAASNTPIESADTFKKDLINIYGLDEKKIKVIPVYNSGYDENVLPDKDCVQEQYLKAINSNLGDFTGIWFTGGDQRKIAQFLYFSNGEETQLLKSIKSIYKKGAVIAGTSAGAAVMSEYMITGGTNKFSDFKNEIKHFWEIDKDDNTIISIGKGLGLFREGIIDQHFGERDRLFRLIGTCLRLKNTKLGFGIDENTAVLIKQPENIIEVIGEGGLTIIDLKRSCNLNDSKNNKIDGIRLHYLLSGDLYNLKNNLPIYKGKNIDELSIPFLNTKDISSPDSSFDALVGLINSQSIKVEPLKVSTYRIVNFYGENIYYKFSVTSNSNIFYNENTLKLSAENITLNIRYTHNE